MLFDQDQMQFLMEIEIPDNALVATSYLLTLYTCIYNVIIDRKFINFSLYLHVSMHMHTCILSLIFAPSMTIKVDVRTIPDLQT